MKTLFAALSPGVATVAAVAHRIVADDAARDRQMGAL
jgi:hypothetical protein